MIPGIQLIEFNECFNVKLVLIKISVCFFFKVKYKILNYFLYIDNSNEIINKIHVQDTPTLLQTF